MLLLVIFLVFVILTVITFFSWSTSSVPIRNGRKSPSGRIGSRFASAQRDQQLPSGVVVDPDSLVVLPVSWVFWESAGPAVSNWLDKWAGEIGPEAVSRDAALPAVVLLTYGQVGDRAGSPPPSLDYSTPSWLNWVHVIPNRSPDFPLAVDREVLEPDWLVSHCQPALLRFLTNPSGPGVVVRNGAGQWNVSSRGLPQTVVISLPHVSPQVPDNGLAPSRPVIGPATRGQVEGRAWAELAADAPYYPEPWSDLALRRGVDFYQESGLDEVAQKTIAPVFWPARYHLTDLLDVLADWTARSAHMTVGLPSTFDHVADARVHAVAVSLTQLSLSEAAPGGWASVFSKAASFSAGSNAAVPAQSPASGAPSSLNDTFLANRFRYLARLSHTIREFGLVGHSIGKGECPDEPECGMSDNRLRVYLLRTQALSGLADIFRALLMTARQVCPLGSPTGSDRPMEQIATETGLFHLLEQRAVDSRIDTRVVLRRLIGAVVGEGDLDRCNSNWQSFLAHSLAFVPSDKVSLKQRAETTIAWPIQLFWPPIYQLRSTHTDDTRWHGRLVGQPSKAERAAERALSDSFQRALWQSQHPKDCSKRKFVYMPTPSFNRPGFGTFTDEIVSALSLAFNTGRTLIIQTRSDSNPWDGPGGLYWADDGIDGNDTAKQVFRCGDEFAGSYRCFFEPVSTCSEKDFNQTRDFPVNLQDSAGDELVLIRPYMTHEQRQGSAGSCVSCGLVFVQANPFYDPSACPMCPGSRFWLETQFVRFFARARPSLLAHFRERRASFAQWPNDPKPSLSDSSTDFDSINQYWDADRPVGMLGLHIRRTDKVSGPIRESVVHNFEKYLEKADLAAKQLVKTTSHAAQKIYLASDDAAVLSEALNSTNRFEFLFDGQHVRVQGGAMLYARGLRQPDAQFDRTAEWTGAFRDIWLLSQCQDAVVGSGSSFFSRTAMRYLCARDFIQSCQHIAAVESDPWGSFYSGWSYFYK